MPGALPSRNSNTRFSLFSSGNLLSCHLNLHPNRFFAIVRLVVQLAPENALSVVRCHNLGRLGDPCIHRPDDGLYILSPQEFLRARLPSVRLARLARLDNMLEADVQRRQVRIGRKIESQVRRLANDHCPRSNPFPERFLRVALQPPCPTCWQSRERTTSPAFRRGT